MNDVATSASDTVKQLGQSFLVSYYLPASVLVAVNVYLLIPAWTGTAVAAPVSGQSTALVASDLTTVVATLLIALLVGITLAALNSTLIRFFEGKLWWQRWLLYPLLLINRRRNVVLYGNLTTLQKEYLRVSNVIRCNQNAQDGVLMQQQLAGLARQIDQEHTNIEHWDPRPILPQNADRVAPTAFGNAWAVVEEYAYRRYGVDAVLFWSRLRGILDDKERLFSERVTHSSRDLDLRVNLAFVFGLLTLEALFMVCIVAAARTVGVIVLGATCVVLYFALYRASVMAVLALGDLIASAFDFHRDLLLKAFGLEPPRDPLSEQSMWVQLAAFVRRGDTFYFPSEVSKCSPE
jgi:hypothetical protein